MLSLADWFLLAVIAVCVVLAVRYAWLHRGKCGGCCGSCKNCGKKCDARTEEKNPPDSFKP